MILGIDILVDWGLEKTAVSEIGLDNDVCTSMTVMGRDTVDCCHDEADLSGVRSASEMCIYLGLVGSGDLRYLFDFGLIKGHETVEDIITRRVVIIATYSKLNYVQEMPS